ncbi:hypothetical protein KY342_03025, partial [Candidatus Woesearchaeota archaeon]|nr:hypothetical protein [Candidatus Woesearchaeota archaeon]
MPDKNSLRKWEEGLRKSKERLERLLEESPEEEIVEESKEEEPVKETPVEEEMNWLNVDPSSAPEPKLESRPSAKGWLSPDSSKTRTAADYVAEFDPLKPVPKPKSESQPSAENRLKTPDPDPLPNSVPAPIPKRTNPLAEEIRRRKRMEAERVELETKVKSHYLYNTLEIRAKILENERNKFKRKWKKEKSGKFPKLRYIILAAVAALGIGYGIRSYEEKPEETAAVETVKDDSLQKRVEELVMQNTKLGKENKQYQSEVKDISRQLSEQKAENKKLTQETGKYQTKINEKEAEIKRIKKAAEDSNIKKDLEFVNAKEETIRLEKAYNELEAKLKKYEGLGDIDVIKKMLGGTKINLTSILAQSKARVKEYEELGTVDDLKRIKENQRHIHAGLEAFLNEDWSNALYEFQRSIL